MPPGHSSGAGVHPRRDEYNRWYLLEKECFVGSAKIARQGFWAMEMVAREILVQWLPEMPELSLT